MSKFESGKSRTQTERLPERIIRLPSNGLILLGAFLIFALGITVGGVQWWLLTRNSKEQASNSREQASAAQTKPAEQQGKAVTQSTPPADEASKLISQRVSTDTPGERQPIAEALALAENAYPNDYRFPFEHAKLTVTGNEHHHAFGLLFMAAQRAIDAGKADQLLADVEREKDGAFYRCARGHEEWKTLENALRNKDKTVLQNAMANMHRDLIGGSDDMIMDKNY
jgi:hypothetical protein